LNDDQRYFLLARYKRKVCELKSVSLVGLKSKDFLLFVVFMQLSVDVAVLFDIPVARQVIGFLCLTFVPGLIILKLLKSDQFDMLESVLFSAGLSIVFLFLAGLLTNEFGFLFGVSQPLSLLPLMVVLNGFMSIGGVLVYLKSRTIETRPSNPVKISPLMILYLSLPILSIVGAVYVTTYGNNLLLLFMIISIAVLVVLGTFSKRLLPSNYYPFALLMITIAILFHASLISRYIVPFGSDIPGEYFVFRITENSAYWNPTLPSVMGMEFGTYNSMLSITVLPTVFVNILHLDPTWLFKLAYPLIFSFVPLVLYQVWQTFLSKKYAFIAAFLFIALETFYTEMLGLSRQMIAELFFALLLLVIVRNKMKPTTKIAFFMIFSFALVVSHYALALIFLFFLAFALVSLIVLKRPGKNVTFTMVVFFFVLMFAWYIYTSGSATFDKFLYFGNIVYDHLNGFFNPASRGTTVLEGLGIAASPSIWNTISRVFAYFTQAFIVLGFISLVTKRASFRIEKEYFMLISAAVVLLAMLIIIPGLANTLNMTRFYQILQFFLAPLCVIGGEFIVKLSSKLSLHLSERKKELAVCALLLIILVPYFLFQTEFVFEVTGSRSWSVPLSGYRMNALYLYGHSGYTDAYNVYGAQWLSANVNAQNSTIYADQCSFNNILDIYATVYAGNSLSNITIVANNSVVYLSTLNVVYGLVPFGQFTANTSQLSFVSDDLNVIYSNSGSVIYKNSP
jgi:uncharacterized membrane protein